MTPKQYELIWISCGLIACLYAANSWLAIQHELQVFKIALFAEGRTPIAWVALLIVPLLTNIGIYAGRRYAATAGQSSVASRIPAPYIGAFAGETTETLLYRTFWLIAFCVFPVLSLIHFANVATDGIVCLVEAPPEADKASLSAQWKSIFWDNSLEDTRNRGYWLANSCTHEISASGARWKAVAEAKVSWFPWLSPALVGVLLGTFLHAAVYLVQLFRNRAPPNEKQRQKAASEHTQK